MTKELNNEELSQVSGGTYTDGNIVLYTLDELKSLAKFSKVNVYMDGTLVAENAIYMGYGVHAQQEECMAHKDGTLYNRRNGYAFGPVNA